MFDVEMLFNYIITCYLASRKTKHNMENQGY